MASVFKRSRSCSTTRPRDRVDRSFTNTTLLGVVCDCAGLQPLLPQVILARYTQNVAVPASLRAHYRTCGFPYEFWHGSKGRVSPPIFRKWATRLRQSVASYNPDAWIVLVIDCAPAHLDRTSVAHLRRLGILTVFVPAALTWLLQVLDVFVFGPFKRELRQAEARARTRTPSGRIVPGQWMKLATTVGRREIINRDWTAAFTQMGCGENCGALTSSVAALLEGRDVRPALPTRAELARLINRPADSAVTRYLHASILGHTLNVQRAHPHAHPPHSATYALPHSLPAAVPESLRARFGQMTPQEAVESYVERDWDSPTFLHAFQDARNFQVSAAPDMPE